MQSLLNRQEAHQRWTDLWWSELYLTYRLWHSASVFSDWPFALSYPNWAFMCQGNDIGWMMIAFFNVVIW